MSVLKQRSSLNGNVTMQVCVLCNQIRRESAQCPRPLHVSRLETPPTVPTSLTGIVHQHQLLQQAAGRAVDDTVHGAQ